MQWPYNQDVCLTCAMCASACPVAGVDDFDPRKMVRMVSLGMLDEVVRIPLALDLHHVRQVRTGLPHGDRHRRHHPAHPLAAGP